MAKWRAVIGYTTNVELTVYVTADTEEDARKKVHDGEYVTARRDEDSLSGHDIEEIELVND